MLDNAVSMLTQGITFLGGVLVVFGLVNLGMTIKDGMQGGGGQLSGAIAMIVGGAHRRWCCRLLRLPQHGLGRWPLSREVGSFALRSDTQGHRRVPAQGHR